MNIKRILKSYEFTDDDQKKERKTGKKRFDSKQTQRRGIIQSNRESINPEKGREKKGSNAHDSSSSSHSSTFFMMSSTVIFNANFNSLAQIFKIS